MADQPPPTPTDILKALRTPTSGPDRLSTAARIAQHFAGQGMQPHAILRVMEPYRLACDPPMSAQELASVIGQAGAYRGQARRAGIVAPPDMAILPSGAGWRYTWPAAGLSIALDRVVELARGGVTAELTIDCDLPDMPARLHGPVRLDMMSTNARAGLARYMAERLPAPWNDLLEAAFRLAIEAHREGEPPVLLSDPLPVGTVEFALAPLLRESDPTLIYAKPGAGKSYLALAAAVTLSGFAVLPMTPARRYRVAWLDWEWHRAPHHRRMRALLGEQVPACDILYRRMSGPLVAQMDGLRRMIHEHGITYIVIDSVAAACGGDPQSAELVIAFGNAVAAFGLGSLWIGHVPKNTPDGQEASAFGSQFWAAYARHAWHLRSESEPTVDRMKLALFHSKANEGTMMSPVGLVYQFDGLRVTITSTDPTHEPAFQPAMSRRDRITAVLMQGSATPGEIATATGMSKRDIESGLRDMAARRMAIEVGGGKWGMLVLPARAPATNGHAAPIPSGAAIAAEIPF